MEKEMPKLNFCWFLEVKKKKTKDDNDDVDLAGSKRKIRHVIFYFYLKSKKPDEMV